MLCKLCMNEHLRGESCEGKILCPHCGVEVTGLECPACLVSFGEPCPDCEGFGYHFDDCPEMAR